MGNFNQYLSEESKAKVIQKFGTDDLWKSYSKYIIQNRIQGDYEFDNRTYELWDSVRKYFELSSRSPTAFKHFKELLTYKKFFPKYLEPDSMWAFRGLKRTKAKLQSMNLKWREFDKNWLVATGTYSNKTGLSSWTTKEPIAWQFAMDENSPSIDPKMSMSKVQNDLDRRFGKPKKKVNAPPLTMDVVWKELISTEAKRDIEALWKIRKKKYGAADPSIITRILQLYTPELFDSTLKKWYDNTTDRDIDYYGSSMEYPLLMQAKVDNDFLFNTAFTNKLAKDTVQQVEYEITRVSKAPIKVEYFIWKDALPSKEDSKKDPTVYSHEDIADFIDKKRLYQKYISYWSKNASSLDLK